MNFQEPVSGFCLSIGGYFGSGLPFSRHLKNAAPSLKIPSRWPKQINLNSFLVSSTVFMLLELVSAIAGGRLAESMSLWFSQKSILKFLFFNVFPFAGHLWYLYALLYSYLIFEIFKSLKINKKHKDYFNSLIHDKLHIKFFSRLLSLPEFPLHWHSLPLDGLSYQGNRGLANVQKGFRIPRTVPVPFLPFRSGNRGIPFPPA